MMTAQKIFVCAVVALVLCNFLFYVSGLNSELLSYGSLIGMFVTVGGIAVAVSVIPTVSGGGTVSWFASSLLMIGLFYHLGFNVLGYNVSLGIGLASHITNMFAGDLSSLSFMPYLFFNALGVIGLISGVIMVQGSGDD